LGAENNAPRTFVYGSPSYNPSNNSVYLATASVCDIAPYHGQIMRVDVTPGATPRVLRRWFVDGSNGPDGGGIWGPGGVAIGPFNKALFVATGNALSFPENQFYADHVVQLGLDLNVEATNSPSDLNNQAVDSDFGSTPLLYHPPGCPPLLAVLNKNGSLYVYNRNAIGNGPTQELFITPYSFIGAAAYDPILKNVYVTSNADDGVGVFSMGSSYSQSRATARWRLLGSSKSAPTTVVPPFRRPPLMAWSTCRPETGARFSRLTEPPANISGIPAGSPKVESSRRRWLPTDSCWSPISSGNLSAFGLPISFAR
jgi:hypothetical protein